HERAGFEPPHYQQSISTDEARNLLPYLYLLRENYSEEMSDPEPTEGVITLLENILAEASEGIIVDDGEEKSEDAEELPGIATMESGSAIPTRKTSKSAFKEMDAYSKQSQREKLEMESFAKRTRKLEGIREHFKREAAKLKHYSLEETQNILTRLHTALSHHGIHATGKSRIRGDHLGFEITAESTGNSTLVGLVLRGKEGFQSGTLKKIIGDHVSNALKLLGVMQQK
ncbi:MAG: hypothetical protein NT128_01735, partial [Proteobacteria bacterium]|nr:hypothetical protein [Pseudomonadota bacterium]